MSKRTESESVSDAGTVSSGETRAVQIELRLHFKQPVAPAVKEFFFEVPKSLDILKATAVVIEQ